MGRTACTEPQCLYKGAVYLFFTSDRIALSKGSTRLSASLPEDGSTAGFQNAEFCIKFRRWTESNIADYVSDWYSIVRTIQFWTANVVQRCLVPRCPNMHNPPSAFRTSFPTHVTQTRMFVVTNYTYIISFWYLRLLEGYLMTTIHNSIRLYVNQLTHKIKSMLLWTADLTSYLATVRQHIRHTTQHFRIYINY
jgi:hypothetical protein